MPSVKLKYGQQTLEIDISKDNLMGVLNPNELNLDGNEEAKILRGLREPLGTKTLPELVQSHHKVAIMVSDITRPSPTKKILPPLLQELANIGVADENITIVFGMGIHREHTMEEQSLLVGEEIQKRYRCVDSTATDDYVSYGTTERGTPIEICRPVADADIRICTGNLEYHYCAGYSGGAKAIMPGASSRRSIEVHHALQLLPGSEIGKLSGNPFREDIEEIGERVGIHFILNAVLNEKKEIVDVVAGDARIAHREGCKVIDQMYGISISVLADIVIVSAGGFPKDISVYQAQKALENAQHAVKPDGIIIMVAECREGAGEEVFRTWMKEANTLEDILDRLKEKFMMGGHKAAAIARILKRAKVFAVTSMVAADTAELFFISKDSLHKAFQDALEEKGPEATVWVLPYGGSTLPRLARG